MSEAETGFDFSRLFTDKSEFRHPDEVEIYRHPDEVEISVIPMKSKFPSSPMRSKFTVIPDLIGDLTIG